ncbi:septum formation initiator family protein [Alloscardovia omnicolens]|nr:septum formation initiator family protein [Alloscardovia omnicolens]MDK6664034.1 septum formation initiator family protein [Alloscardovia omnicolens]MDK7748392.1 septum formation initiator family protein [Alloscardovia omnicolens]
MASRHRTSSSRSTSSNRSSSSARTARSRSSVSRSATRDELRDIMNSRNSRKSQNESRGRTARRESSGKKRSEQKPSARSSSAKNLSVARAPRGGLSFFLGIIIFLLAALNIGLVFKSYAQNLGQLNALRNQEAELIQKKADLENDISRWSDDAYVTAQARKRLGFVFPGERSVLVKNAPQDAQHNSTEEKSRTEDKKLPWYNEILYAMESTDRAENPNGATSQAQ